MRTAKIILLISGLSFGLIAAGSGGTSQEVIAKASTTVRALDQSNSSSAPGASTTAHARDASAQKHELTVEAIFGKTPITGEPPSSIRWVPNSKGISYFEKETDDSTKHTLFVISSVPAGKRKIICIADTITIPEDLRKKSDDKFSMGGYEWAKTSDCVVFTFKGEIFTLDPSNARIRRITNTKEKEENVAFSPDGKLLAFVRAHDLFTINVKSGEQIKVTTTGCDSVFNGDLDWVYMEELFTRGDTKAYWWSPDSRRIAFLEFRESHVPEFPIVDYSSTPASLEMQRYPQPGDPNPAVRLGVYDTKTGETIWLDSIKETDDYIARVNWLEDSKRLAVQILNRAQNTLKLCFADVTDGKIETVLGETDSTWINITYIEHFYKTKSRFIWASERDGFSHLYLYKNDGGLIRKLTKGPWVVTSLDGVDEKNGRIYFTALAKSILERHLYSVSHRGTNLQRITQETGTHRIDMSPDCRYYIDYYSNASTPASIAVYSSKGRQQFPVGKSSTEKLDACNPSYPEFLTFTSEEGITYNCSMIKPAGFDSTKKYPVIVYVYGGPHAQIVQDSWGGPLQLWHSMMASRGYIIFSLDNRGSFGRGKAWETAIARRAGTLELHDQLEGVKYLESLPFVDAWRIGIWGWSYGGFMTCMALLKSPGVFKAGAAVAPVTDWRFYDSIYTERYMGMPDDNKKGYDENSVLDCADSLKAALLLVHGTVDNNVHMQNSIRLIDKLIKAGKDFDFMVYPGREHSIRGEEARIHLFKKITKFFEENL
jgi:dipeptidyl-peptidase-4